MNYDKEKRREYLKKWREKNKEKIREWYQKNKEKISERRKKYYQENKERAKEYYESNKEKIGQRHKEYWKKNKERLGQRYKEWYQENKEWHQEYNRDFRLKVLNHYGSKCNCCGESQYEFLSVDHIDGNGAKHRREIKRGSIYRWLVQNNYPASFQILCFNCNCAKGFFGKCPHSKKSSN